MKDYTFLNSSIISTEGIFRKKKISFSDLNHLIDENGIYSFSSAIGHQSTANVLNKLLCLTGTDAEIPVNRMKFTQTVNDIAIVLQLKERLPEGKILTREEIEEIGYDFFIIEKLAD